MNRLIELREARLRLNLGEISGEAEVGKYPSFTGYFLKLKKMKPDDTDYIIRSQRDRRMPKRYITLEAACKELETLGISQFRVNLQERSEPRIDR